MPLPRVKEPRVILTPVTVWLTAEIAAACMSEASRAFPLESGGTFMGYHADSDTVVVTAVIGPGPHASHGHSHFEPDQAWQLDEIARLYAESGRRQTYVGDWHSHPNASSGEVSDVDRRVLKSIMKTPAARCRRPLMALLYGNPTGWQLDMWRARLTRRACFASYVVVDRAAVRYA